MHYKVILSSGRRIYLFFRVGGFFMHYKVILSSNLLVLKRTFGCCSCSLFRRTVDSLEALVSRHADTVSDLARSDDSVRRLRICCDEPTHFYLAI